MRFSAVLSPMSANIVMISFSASPVAPAAALDEAEMVERQHVDRGAR